VKPDGLLTKYLSRNYHLAVLVIGVSAFGLFRHLVSGGEWASIALGVITAFRAGDAMVNWLQTRGKE
jgi:hypothetical protein